MNKIILALIGSLLLFLMSCEGMNVAQGKIIDSTTNTSILGVKCRVLENDNFVYSDEQGEYYIEGPFGSCVRSCENMNVEYSKKGYKTKTILNPGNQTILLEK